MKKRVSRISILQSVKVATVLYAVIGLLYGLLGTPMVLFGGKEMQIAGIIYLFMPVLAAMFGFIFFVIFSATYNLVARWLGSFEFEITEVP